MGDIIEYRQANVYLYCILGRSLAVLLLLLFSNDKASAQGYVENYELFSTRNGLPNNIVLSIAQDDNNLLWIGTRNGLCIYDGHEFEIRRDLFDAKDGPWGNIFCTLFNDGDGNMWIGTMNGRVAMYTRKQDSIVQFDMPKVKELEYLSAAWQDPKGQIWMGSNRGTIYSVARDSRKLIIRKRMDGVGINNITGDEYGNPVINGTNDSARSRGNGPKKKVAGRLLYASFQKGGMCLHNDKNTAICVNDTEVLSKFHYVSHIARGERILIATSQLIKEYDMNGNLLNRIEVGNGQDNNNEDNPNFIFEDATGIIWLGTNWGLVKIDRYKYRFAKFTTNGTYGKLNSNYVRSVFVDNKNNMWVGYKAGLINKLVLDSTTGKYKSFTCRYKDKIYASCAINIIRQLKSRQLLLGGSCGLFYLTPGVNPVLEKFSLKNDKNNLIDITEVWSICQDKNGKVWVGTRGQGLFIVDPETHKCKSYPYGGQNGLSSVWRIHEDHSGYMWLATENGLDSVVLAADGYPSGFYNLHEHYKGNTGRQVWSIEEDMQHHLWIGTTDNGFSLVDKKDHRFITYNKGNGLPGNVTCGMLHDKRGNLWISTLNGISKFNTATATFEYFTDNDGLTGNDFNFNACCRSPSGELFFGAKSGLVAFFPDSVSKKRNAQAPVVIRAVNLWNKLFLKNPGSDQPIGLRYDQNSFSFRFAIPEYANPMEHQFQYMLEGFDDHWFTTDARNPVAAYTNISPGNYTLHVRGSIDGRTWSSKITSLQIIVRPALWQRPLFLIILAGIIIVAVILLVYSRFNQSIKRERERNQLNQKFAELELRALQAQMNPHFIFNSINAIQHFMLTNNELAANAYLTKFARLMRLYFESSHKKYITISEEVELLKLYVTLEKLRFEDKFDYTFFVDAYFENSAFLIPSMLLQPFVENAINHGLAMRRTKGWLRISFTKTGNGLLCTIDDNGIGRRKAAASKTGSNGKPRSSDTIGERLNAYRLADNIEVRTIIIDKTDDKGNNTGTKVELEIPDLN